MTSPCIQLADYELVLCVDDGCAPALPPAQVLLGCSVSPPTGHLASCTDLWAAVEQRYFCYKGKSLPPILKVLLLPQEPELWSPSQIFFKNPCCKLCFGVF